MSSTTEKATIEALFQKLERAHVDHDADTIVDSYAPEAVVFDLAPPLGRRGMKRDNVAAWLAGWDGPIQIDARDVSLTVSGDLAFVSALNRMRGRQGSKDQDMWYRTTMCLQKINGDGKSSAITHLCPFIWMGAIEPRWTSSHRGGVFVVCLTTP